MDRTLSSINFYQVEKGQSVATNKVFIIKTHNFSFIIRRSGQGHKNSLLGSIKKNSFYLKLFY